MQVRWVEGNDVRSARWRSEAGSPPPTEVVVGTDELTADEAYRLARNNTAILWSGDFNNARQLLTALGRRVDRSRKKVAAPTSAEAFHRYRQERALTARLLGRLLVPLEPGHVVPLRRSPDVREALTEAFGPADELTVMSLRELLGAVSAHEWRRRGVEVPSLGARVYPRFGVFSPVRGEYVDLVAEAPLPDVDVAFDVGTGTGVLAAVLLNRGVEKVVATDQDERALDCARDNLTRLGFGDRVDLVRTDLFPSGRASLVVCNPPWLPGKPRSPLEHAVYDPGGRMLRAFLDRLGRHLVPGGEGWLVLSDLAERLGLRTRRELLAAFSAAGLVVAGRTDTRPVHPRASDPDDPLHAARGAEVTSLWRLVVE
ncbi:methylase of polypeptide subunit release factors [Stackebrandtia endophytica]|uniref:Methylase of polypeptide subunit release factors n=1 Tax=Stackebrandtia endophytica TaxID=1496996 RepID=A0A543B023_9ACTN|nr:class I SAM-dependent methyltransferase [Stackebrandtia endophytica]TQL78169.1 methylase of polypeptide subunit release factors [Stackebrandtia endophytica]